MDGYLTTKQTALITGATEQQIAEYVRQGVIRPAVVGHRSAPHQFKLRHGLAIGVGQVLRRLAMRGKPVHNAMRLIVSHDSGAWDRVMESRPVLAVLPGVAVVSELVPREHIQGKAAMYMATLGVMPVGIDLDLMDRKMRACIEEHEANGWQELDEPATEPKETEATK